jgi:hypothetical protein
MNEKENVKRFFTQDDIHTCWSCGVDLYLLALLNGEDTVEELRKDFESLIGSKYDARVLAKANRKES